MKKIFSLSVVFFSFSLFANASEKTQEYALGNSAYIRVRVIQSGENSDLKKLSLVKFEGGGQTLGFYNSNASYLITFDFNERTHILRYTLSEDVAKNGLLTNTYELNVDSMKVKLSQSRSAIMLNSPY